MTIKQSLMGMAGCGYSKKSVVCSGLPRVQETSAELILSGYRNNIRFTHTRRPQAQLTSETASISASDHGSTLLYSTKPKPNHLTWLKSAISNLPTRRVSGQQAHLSREYVYCISPQLATTESSRTLCWRCGTRPPRGKLFSLSLSLSPPFDELRAAVGVCGMVCSLPGGPQQHI